MLTYHDCLGLCDAAPEEVEVVARHEHLPPMVATEKAHTVLQQNWGPPALRQMIRDELHRARRCGRGDTARALETLHTQAQERHPGGIDRRETRR